MRKDTSQSRVLLLITLVLNLPRWIVSFDVTWLIRYCTCLRQRSSDMVRSCLERASSSSSSFQLSPSPGEQKKNETMHLAGTLEARRCLKTAGAQIKNQ